MMRPMPLETLFRPSSVAVVGGSPRSFMGMAVLNNLKGLSFRGPVTVVNPKYEEVVGFPAVPSVSAIEDPVDLAVVQIGVDRVAAAIEESIETGIRNFVVPGGGFTDSGQAADQLVADLKAMQRSEGIRVVGPNTMGVVDLVSGAAPYVGTVPSSVRPGSVAVVSQSGAVCEAFVNAGGRVPISTAVSTGAEATVDLADCLDFFSGDPATTSVLGFVETVRRPEKLLESLERMNEAGKPIGLLLIGQSAVAKAGIISHSGRLAPDHRIARSALAQAGAVMADDLDELMALGELFAAGIHSIGKRAAVVVNSGGEGNLLADLAAGAGIDLPPLSRAAADRLTAEWPRFRPSNPLDPWGVADYSEVYPTAILAAAAEDVDMVIVAQDQQTTCGDYEKKLGRDLARYLGEGRRKSQQAAVFLSPTSHDPPRELVEICRDEGVALLRGAAPSLRAIGRLANRSTSLDLGLLAGESDSDLELHAQSGVLSESQGLALLDSAGVATPRRLEAATAEGCIDAAVQIGYPVVVKGTAEDLAHKSELGLVHTGIGSRTMLDEALEQLEDRRRESDPLELSYIVGEHVTGALELLIGFNRDTTFGPTTVVGLGGVWAELLDVVAVRVGRVNRDQALAMLDECGLLRMLTEARRGALALEAVVSAICSISDFGIEHQTITALEVNPLIVDRDRAVAVDCLAVLEEAANTNGRNQ